MNTLFSTKLEHHHAKFGALFSHVADPMHAHRMTAEAPTSPILLPIRIVKQIKLLSLLIVQIWMVYNYDAANARAQEYVIQGLCIHCHLAMCDTNWSMVDAAHGGYV